jgi:hypothetical protein
VDLSQVTARAIAALVLVGSLAAGLAGCGPSAEETFRKEHLRPVQLRIDAAKSQLSTELQTARLGRKRDARAMGALVSTLAARVRELAALKPPGSLRDLFRRYVLAHRHLVAALRRFATLLGGHDERALNGEADAAQAAAGEIARARDALDAKLVASR